METIRLFFRSNSFRNNNKSSNNLKEYILSDPLPLNNYQLERSSDLSDLKLSKNVSNKQSLILFKNNLRRHSWNENNDQFNYLSSSSIRRTKSLKYNYHFKNKYKYSTKDKIKQNIIQINRSTKSFSYPISTINQNSSSSVKSTSSNAFITAASLFKYWVYASTFSFFVKFSIFILCFLTKYFY